MSVIALLRVALVLLASLLSLDVTASAWGSATLLLEQPYGELGAFNPTGHSALYLDHICADTPTTLRPCRPGELGAVISRYDGIDHYDWLAIPLVPYLYAVETRAEIPEWADRALATGLRDTYRREHLEAIAPDAAGGVAPGGNWYELVGGSYDRTIFGFRVKTTADQDAMLIAYFNDRRNREVYNGAFRNCADFTRETLNMLYPHAVRRNFIADVGLTTPKSVARGLAHYAKKHPEAEMQMFVIPQVKGPIRRSVDVQGVSESLLKRYGIPLILLSPTTTGVVLAAYITHGRFPLPKKAPVLDLAELERNAGVSAAMPLSTVAAENMAQQQPAPDPAFVIDAQLRLTSVPLLQVNTVGHPESGVAQPAASRLELRESGTPAGQPPMPVWTERPLRDPALPGSDAPTLAVQPLGIE